MEITLGRCDKRSALPLKDHQAFLAAVVGGESDARLAHRFSLSERTATNYRVRAEKVARSLGLTVPDRPRRAKKGGPSETAQAPTEADARNGDCTPAASPTRTQGGS